MPINNMKNIKGYDVDFTKSQGLITIAKQSNSDSTRNVSTLSLLSTVADMLVHNQQNYLCNPEVKPMRLVYFSEQEDLELRRTLDWFLNQKHNDSLDGIKARTGAEVKFNRVDQTISHKEIQVLAENLALHGYNKNKSITLFIFDKLSTFTPTTARQTLVSIINDTMIKCILMNK